jgi:hypothetical protein
MSGVVLVELGGRLSIFESSSYAAMKKAVDDAYGDLVRNPKTHEISLTFDFRGLTMDVKSQQTLVTFLTLCKSGEVASQDGLPLLHVALTEKITSIPTIEELEAELAAGGGAFNARGKSASRPSSAQGFSRPSSAAASRNGNGSRHVAAPDYDERAAVSQQQQQQQQQPSRGRKAANPSSQSAAPLDIDSPPRRNGGGLDGTVSSQESLPVDSEVSYAMRVFDQPAAKRDRPNSAVARELLDSFHTSSPPEPPSIRVLMRDGSSSCLMPYDVQAPPSVAVLRRAVWDRFGEVLEDRVAELRASAQGKAAEKAQGKPIVAGSFLMSFWFEGCDLPVDIEDQSDLELLHRAVERFGLDGVQLYADVPFVEPINIDPDIITNTVLPKTPRGLQVNQTRLPSRLKQKVPL